MIELDGSAGEGGGQILRTALSLSLITGKSFRISNIRANRKKPGLRLQHLAAVRAMAEIGGARTKGVDLDATAFTFEPGKVTPGDYRFDIGSAGSAILVLQTILPAFLKSSELGQIRLIGGTHNPGAPTFDFLEKTYLPFVEKCGASVKLRLKRRGFYPAGGGKFLAQIRPTGDSKPLIFTESEKVVHMRSEILLSNLPEHIADRERRVLLQELGLSKKQVSVQAATEAAGPGNVIQVFVEREHHTEVFTAFGRRGIRAETVAEEVCAEVNEYLEVDAPIGKYLADQLLLPLAITGGEFLTGPLTEHSRTNIGVIETFLDVRFVVQETGIDQFLITIHNL